MTDDEAMVLALEEAAAALVHNDVPVGAIALDRRGEVVARRHNERELQHDPTAHAELLAISEVAQATGSWRLTDITVVVTLEPCAMCAGALVAARVPRLIFGALDPKAGAIQSLYEIGTDARLNHRLAVTGGVRAEECGALLRAFFAGRRRRSAG